MSTLLCRTTVTAISAALLLASATGAASAEPSSKAITCEDSTSNGDTFYHGKSASYAYDERFSTGPELSGAELDAFTPQGAAWLENYSGSKDILLATTYSDDATISHIVGLDPSKSGENATIGTVRIDKSHVGGIAVHGDWVFVSGAGHTIQKYKVSDVKAGIEKGKPGTDGKPRIEPVGKDREVYGSSFLSVDGNHLYAGKFNDSDRDKMYRYKIGSDGSLTTESGAWEVPTKTQGLFVHDGKIVYSTSYGRGNRSNVYSVKADVKDLDQASPNCFRAPSMAEGITKAPNGNAYLLFESGSHQYDGTDGEKARNVIPGFHKAKVTSLTSY